MSAVFTLAGEDAGESKIVNGRYKFVDGELECDDATGKLYEPILCGYFGCSVEYYEDDSVEDKSDDAEASLNKDNTKQDD